MARLLENRTALVTGAGSGIGRASARLFAREGARVLASDLDEKGGEETVAQIKAQGGQASFVRADLTRESEVEALVERAVETLGRLDCAHNNAGITGVMGPVQEIELEGWSHTLATNLTSVFLCLKYEIPVMQRQGAGAIVNTSSGAGVIGVPALAAYTASKHGLLGLTKTAALENARTGVRINAVCPGSIDTPMLQRYMALDSQIERGIRANQPGGRLGTAEEIAEAVVWLCSERASFVTGESMLVDGGAVAR